MGIQAWGYCAEGGRWEGVWVTTRAFISHSCGTGLRWERFVSSLSNPKGGATVCLLHSEDTSA